jgi:hypothetical protein
VQDSFAKENMGKRMGRCCLSPCTRDLNHGAGQLVLQQLPHCLMMGYDRNPPVEKERVVRVKMDRGNNKVIDPRSGFREEIRGGTVVHIHDIRSVAGVLIRPADLRSAMNCVQYQNVHSKKKGQR